MYPFHELNRKKQTKNPENKLTNRSCPTAFASIALTVDLHKTCLSTSLLGATLPNLALGKSAS